MPLRESHNRPLTLRLVDRLGEPTDLADLGIRDYDILRIRRGLVKLAIEGRLFRRDFWDNAHHHRVYPERLKDAYLLESIDIEILGLKVVIVTGLPRLRPTIAPPADSLADLGRNTSIVVSQSTPLAWVDRGETEARPSFTLTRKLARQRQRRAVMRAFFT